MQDNGLKKLLVNPAQLEAIQKLDPTLQAGSIIVLKETGEHAELVVTPWLEDSGSVYLINPPQENFNARWTEAPDHQGHPAPGPDNPAD